MSRFKINIKYQVALYFGCCLLFYFSLPDILFTEPYSKVLYARDQQLLGAHIATDGQWRFPMPESLPHRFEKAIVAFEDERYWRHPGIDPKSIVRAFWKNLSAGKIEEGASTISMQVIRLSRKNKPRNIYQKIIESFLALRL